LLFIADLNDQLTSDIYVNSIFSMRDLACNRTEEAVSDVSINVYVLS
jgi:hypothetical protein